LVDFDLFFFSRNNSFFDFDLPFFETIRSRERSRALTAEVDDGGADPAAARGAALGEDARHRAAHARRSLHALEAL
jgi:hypothetical protein